MLPHLCLTKCFLFVRGTEGNILYTKTRSEFHNPSLGVRGATKGKGMMSDIFLVNCTKSTNGSEKNSLFLIPGLRGSVRRGGRVHLYYLQGMG